MSLRINNNVESLNAHRHLINNDKQLSKSIERLSSGQKINRGADSPASLVISEGMRAQIGSLQQAADNNEAAISLVQTAEGALNEVSKLLVDMRQRAVSAANLGINDQNSVNASQKELKTPWRQLTEFRTTPSLAARTCWMAVLWMLTAIH